jgi:prevent-host-death family protein
VGRIGYGRCVPETIAQRKLRCDSAEIMRRVEAGESFIITRNGKPVADLVPHAREPKRRKTLRELQEDMRKLPPIDVEQWYRDGEADEEYPHQPQPLDGA